jgi:hypothetical protein
MKQNQRIRVDQWDLGVLNDIRLMQGPALGDTIFLL